MRLKFLMVFAVTALTIQNTFSSPCSIESEALSPRLVQGFNVGPLSIDLHQQINHSLENFERNRLRWSAWAGGIGYVYFSQVHFLTQEPILHFTVSLFLAVAVYATPSFLTPLYSPPFAEQSWLTRYAWGEPETTALIDSNVYMSGKNAALDILLSEIKNIVHIEGIRAAIERLEKSESDPKVNSHIFYWVVLSQLYRQRIQEVGTESDHPTLRRKAYQAASYANFLAHDNPYVLSELAYVYQLTGDTPKALEILREHLPADGAIIHAAVGSILLKDGQLEAGYQSLQQSVDYGNRKWETIRLLAHNYQTETRYADALRVLEIYLGEKPRSIEPLELFCQIANQLTVQYLLDGHLEMANTTAAKIRKRGELLIAVLNNRTLSDIPDRERTKKTARAYYERGYSELIVRHALAAIDHLHLAITYDSTVASYYEALISAYLQEGERLRASCVLIRARGAHLPAHALPPLRKLVYPSIHSPMQKVLATAT